MRRQQRKNAAQECPKPFRARRAKTLRADLLGALVFVHEGVGAADLLLEFLRARNIHDPELTESA